MEDQRKAVETGYFIVLPQESPDDTPDQPIEVRLGKDTMLAKLSYDGHSTSIVEQHNSILITRYPQPLTLLHPEDYDYFQVLRNKLYWSANY